MWKRVGSVAKPFINSKKELHSTARQTHPVVYKHVGYVDIIRGENYFENSMVGDKVYFYYINPNKYYTNDRYEKDLKTERKL